MDLVRSAKNNASSLPTVNIHDIEENQLQGKHGAAEDYQTPELEECPDYIERLRNQRHRIINIYNAT